MRVIGFDTETTGLNTAEDHIIEVGAVLWDTERKCPLAMHSELILPRIADLDPKITQLTGIEYRDLQEFGGEPKAALQRLNKFFKLADVVVAHNGNLFDRPIYEAHCERYEQKPIDLLWVDTSCDVSFPADMHTRKLKHLAAEHGFLNPFEHRAIFDVLTMMKVAAGYDWEQILHYARAKTLVVQAVTTFHQKELAKKQNYRWDNENKMWIKSIKEFQLDETKQAAQDAGFKIALIRQ